MKAEKRMGRFTRRCVSRGADVKIMWDGRKVAINQSINQSIAEFNYQIQTYDKKCHDSYLGRCCASCSHQDLRLRPRLYLNKGKNHRDPWDGKRRSRASRLHGAVPPLSSSRRSPGRPLRSAHAHHPQHSPRPGPGGKDLTDEQLRQQKGVTRTLIPRCRRRDSPIASLSGQPGRRQSRAQLSSSPSLSPSRVLPRWMPVTRRGFPLGVTRTVTGPALKDSCPDFQNYIIPVQFPLGVSICSIHHHHQSNQSALTIKTQSTTQSKPQLQPTLHNLQDALLRQVIHPRLSSNQNTRNTNKTQATLLELTPSTRTRTTAGFLLRPRLLSLAPCPPRPRLSSPSLPSLDLSPLPLPLEPTIRLHTQSCILINVWG